MVGVSGYEYTPDDRSSGGIFHLLCGLGHHRLSLEIRVVPQVKFCLWLWSVSAFTKSTRKTLLFIYIPTICHRSQQEVPENFSHEVWVNRSKTSSGRCTKEKKTYE